MVDLSEVTKALLDSSVALLKDDAQGALAHARRAVALAPENASCYCAMAEALVDLGRGPEAIDAIRKALALGPTDAVVLCHAIRIYREASDPDSAFEVADRATRLYPADAETWRLRAELHLWYGSVLEALQSAKRAIELHSLKWDPRASSTAAYAHGLLGQWRDADKHFVIAGPEERRWGWFARRRHVFDLRWRRQAMRLVLWMRRRVVAMGAAPDRA